MAENSAPGQSRRSAWIAALLSLILPGAGQFYARHRYRAVSIFLSMAIMVVVVIWYKVPVFYLAPGAAWIWNVWDAFSAVGGRLRSPFLPIAALLVIGYGIGWQITEINLPALAQNIDRAKSILRPMLQPDFLAREEISQSGWAPVEVPCGPNPPASTNTVNGISVEVSPNCAALSGGLTVHASGLWPSTDTLIQWSTPIGDRLPLGKGFITNLNANTDADGKLDIQIQVPPDALSAAPDPTIPLEHRVYLTQSQTQPGYKLSKNGDFVVKGIVETLFLALMATTFGTLGAIPVSFLAARNLMGGNPITLIFYTLTRTVLNIVRSIEPLIIAIIFVVIVGLGPFAGVIAMSLHTIAALGKLYSEVIEGIDPGPLEAIRATGGNWLQMVRYAVVPQIVPPFASFTLFRWDINVRTSTIIGFVGGGGIGFYLYQWIIKGDYRAVSSSFIAIAVIVMVLDFVSAKVRARLI